MTSFRQLENTATPGLERFAGMLSEDGRVKIQNAGAFRFAEMAANNFGMSGESRPEPWKILTWQYAKEFHGGQRIPTLILSGELQDSIKIDSSPESAVVTANAEYASDHQFGDSSRNLPPRPFFPMDESEQITPYAEQQVMDAMQQQLDVILEVANG